MVDGNPQHIGKAQNTIWPVLEFGFLSILFGAILGLASAYMLSTPVWTVAVFSTGVGIAVHGLWTQYPHNTLGLCNVVTLARAAAIALLFGALFEPDAVSGWVVFYIAIVAFALDGLDGYLARRSRLQSGFGARFDMETDAALGAILATWLLVSGTTGVLVLVLGFLRYLFIAAGWVMPALKEPLPDSLRRKTICVVQVSALIILALPGLPGGLVLPTLIGAAGVLVYSFLVDTVWLLRRRA